MSLAKFPINNAGSRAGRGFRYQDGVGALLAVQGWSGASEFGQVTPEANDDCDLASNDRTVFAQIKSRRQEAGLFTVGKLAGFVTALWDRHDAAASPPDELWLILERSFKNAPPLPSLAPLPAVLVASEALRGDPRAANLVSKTRIMVVPAPMNEAVALIAETLECTPAEGSIHYAAVLREIGRLSDDNGFRPSGDFASVGRTDVSALIDATRGLVALDDMDAALQAGLCEAVDFLTPIMDPDFYLGVDVEPGHLAAGLVVERPETRADVISALETRGQTLVAGPSGSGKSALMWDAASATRHVVRWYRVRAATPTQVPVLLRLARALRAAPATPVGFIFDDVGGDLRGVWDAISRLTPAASGTVLLGSVREEDLFQLETRSRFAEVRADPDDGVAERLWTELREAGRTDWPGWREPWAQSGGLMLEFAHILTQGQRMAAVLAAQVDRREREGRDLELSVLRVASFAGAASAVIDGGALARQLGESEADVGRTLRRLVDEHLVRTAGGGLIGGLHQLRSRRLLELTHRNPPPSLARTISDAVPVVPADNLEGLVAKSELADGDLEALITALADRLNAEPDPLAAAAAFRGLGERHVRATLEAWLPAVLARDIPPTRVSTAVMFAVARSEPIDLPQMEQLNAATADLVAAEQDDPRAALLARLSAATMAALSQTDLAGLDDILASLVGVDATAFLEAMGTRAIDLSAEPLDLTVRLLGTIGLHDLPLAGALVDAAGQQGLLDRLHAETPWTSPFTVTDEDDGRVVNGEVRWVAPSLQTDVHEEVVTLVDKLFALAPGADLAAISAVSPDGLPAGLPDYPMAVKRMVRTAAPADALPRWNRRWMSGISALVGAPSYSDFLERGYAGLALAVPALDQIIEARLRGKDAQAGLIRLGEAYDIALALTSPASAVAVPGAPASDSGAYVSDLQSLIHDAASEVPRKFIGLPDANGAFQYWTNGLLDQIEKVRREPWGLIGKDPTTLLDRYRDILLSLRVVAGEASERGRDPAALWASVAKSARPRNALRRVAHQATIGHERRIAEIRTAMVETLVQLGLTGTVHLQPVREVSTDWPFASVLIVLEVDSPSDFIPLVLEHWPALKAAAGDGRSLALAPKVHGLVVSRHTISGIGAALPSPGKVDEQLRATGHLLLDEVQTTRLGELFDALYEIDAIRQYGYGEAGRPELERETLEAALRKRSDALERLVAGVRAELPSFPATLEAFVRLVDTGAIRFAEDLASTMHGVLSPAGQQVDQLQSIMVQVDLIAHLKRREAEAVPPPENLNGGSRP